MGKLNQDQIKPEKISDQRASVRIQNLRIQMEEILRKNGKSLFGSGASLSLFLRYEVKSLVELNTAEEFIKEKGLLGDSLKLRVEQYRAYLARKENPEKYLPPDFDKEFPVLSKKLVGRGEKYLFLRAQWFAAYCKDVLNLFPDGQDEFSMAVNAVLRAKNMDFPHQITSSFILWKRTESVKGIKVSFSDHRPTMHYFPGEYRLWQRKFNQALHVLAKCGEEEIAEFTKMIFGDCISGGEGSWSDNSLRFVFEWKTQPEQ